MREKKRWIVVTLLFVIFLQGIVLGKTVCEAAGKGIYFLAGDLYYHTLSGSKVEVCGTKKTSGTLTVPASVRYNGKSYTVTGFADLEIYSQDNPITEETKDGFSVAVDMPGWRYYHYNRQDGKDMPTDVGCIASSDIRKVVLPNTLTYIGEGTFCGCKKLKSVKFADKYQQLTIGKNAFGDTKLKSIQFPNGTYELKDGAAGTIPEIYIPATVKKMGMNVVNYATKKVTIHKQNKQFKMKNGILYTYNEKTLLGVSGNVGEQVKISSKTKEIAEQAFAGSKVKTVTLNNKISTIPKGAFYNCKNLTTVKKTGKVKSIQYAAFALCPNLTGIKNISNLERIERAAFWEDIRLNISLSAKLTDVDVYAFSGTKNSISMKIDVDKENSVLSSVDGFLIKKEKDKQIVMMQPSGTDQVVIPEGVTDVAVAVGGIECKSVTFPSTLLKQEGIVRAKGGTITYQTKEVPELGADFDISSDVDIITKVIVPSGSGEKYKKSIADVVNLRDEYDIWEFGEVVLQEQ